MQAQLTLENAERFRRTADLFPKAAARALNKMNAQVFTLTKQTIREKYNIQSSKLATRFKKAKATPRNLAVGILAVGRPLSLAYFGARWRLGAVGTTIEVIRGKRRMLAGRFVSIMASGHKGVFYRGTTDVRREKKTSPTTGKEYKSHMPIVELWTISGAEMFIAARVQRVIDKFINKKFPVLMEHEIEFERSKK